MGMNIVARLMYGLFYDDLVEGLTEDEIEHLDEEIDDGLIDIASPYYDSSREKWFIGFQMGEFFDLESVGTFIEELKKCESKFKIKFGKTGQVLAAKDVT